MSSDNDQSVSLDNVRNFLLSHSGKVSQEDILDVFPDVVSEDEATKTEACKALKDILQLITVVREDDDGAKYIHLAERYRSNIAYKNAQEELNVRLASTGEENEQLHTPAPLSPEKLKLSSSSVEKTEDTCKESVSDSPTEKRRRRARLSAVEGLRQAFHLKSESLESFDSEDSDNGDTSTDIHNDDMLWMIACSNGNLHLIKDLLLKHPHLLTRKDFALGYTVLHWAAKLGRKDILDFVVECHKPTDVEEQPSKEYLHLKSHGGYTPLHIAAMCGKDDVIVALIGLGADTHARDYNGNKPRDLVKDTVADTVQYRLGRAHKSTFRRSQAPKSISFGQYSTESDKTFSPIESPKAPRKLHLSAAMAKKQMSAIWS